MEAYLLRCRLLQPRSSSVQEICLCKHRTSVHTYVTRAVGAGRSRSAPDLACVAHNPPPPQKKREEKRTEASRTAGSEEQFLVDMCNVAWCACSTPSDNISASLKVALTLCTSTVSHTHRSLRRCTRWPETAACPAWTRHQRACKGSGCARGWC